MRKGLSLLLALLWSVPASILPGASPLRASAQNQQPAQAPGNPLTNKDVLEMLRTEQVAEVVIAKIKSSPCNFDVSPPALQALKTAAVPDAVVLAMVQASVGPLQGPDPAATPAAPPPPESPEFVEAKITDGTPCQVELKANVSSEELAKDSTIDLSVLQSLKINGLTVIEKGASARARVVEVKKARHWGRAGRVLWAMQDILAVDGSRIPARFTNQKEGRGSSGKIAAAVVTTGIVFFPAAPLWGIKKGKPAVIPAGQRFEVFLEGDRTVKVKPATQPTDAQPQRQGEAQPATPPKQAPRPTPLS